MQRTVATLLFSLILCTGLCMEVALGEALPSEGLCLHLKVDEGLETRGNQVIAWRDLSPAGHVARVVPGSEAPTLDAKASSVTFGSNTLMAIPQLVLPRKTREMTILAVARTDKEMSVSLLGIRDGAVPLIQLDVDEYSNARFIVRDKNSKTLLATTPAVLKARTTFGGVLKSTLESNGRFQGTAQVFYGFKGTAKANGTFSLPIVAPKTWIGGLVVPGREPFHWQGSISEIVVYDRALPQEKIKEIFEVWTEKYNLAEAKTKPVSDLPGPVITDPQADTEFQEMETDVCIVGGGSGGFGAALAAAREGVDVVLVERQEKLGGTSTHAFVNNWEPGPGCDFAKELFERLQKKSNAIGVTTNINKGGKMGSFGFYMWDPAMPYEESIPRAIRQPKDYHTISFDADEMARAMQEMLEETGHVKILFGTTFVKAHSGEEDSSGHSKRVEAIDIVDQDGQWSKIKAKVFIDATGGVHLCRKLGCEVMLGADPQSRFDESGAPKEPQHLLNAISRCYQVRRIENPKRQEKPVPTPNFCRAAHVTQSGKDTLTINPLPVLPGTALVDQGYDACLEKTEKAVEAHWNWLQSLDVFKDYELDKLSPMLGIRESYRVKTKYVLREQDLMAGWDRQKHDDLIAVADHPCDIHGAGGGLGHVSGPYGVPYRCLLPEGGWTNLMVACRGAGFSKIAASSCRLSRTMIQLGHAAGLGAAMAIKTDKPVDEIDIEALTKRLNIRSRYPRINK